jgi:hypothetical protein
VAGCAIVTEEFSNLSLSYLRINWIGEVSIDTNHIILRGPKSNDQVSQHTDAQGSQAGALRSICNERVEGM